MIEWHKTISQNTLPLQKHRRPAGRRALKRQKPTDPARPETNVSEMLRLHAGFRSADSRIEPFHRSLTQRA